MATETIESYKERCQKYAEKETAKMIENYRQATERYMNNKAQLARYNPVDELNSKKTEEEKEELISEDFFSWLEGYSWWD